jgi:hypothetical protein
MLDTSMVVPHYHQLKLHIQAQLGSGVQQLREKAPQTES